MRVPYSDKLQAILKPSVLYWGIILTIVYSFVFGNTGFIKLYRLWNESKRLEKEITVAQKQNEFLKQEVEQLSDPNDLSRIELEARKLGMAAKDEVVIMVR